jgi:hypothetical protein
MPPSVCLGALPEELPTFQLSIFRFRADRTNAPPATAAAPPMTPATTVRLLTM